MIRRQAEQIDRNDRLGLEPALLGGRDRLAQARRIEVERCCIDVGKDRGRTESATTSAVAQKVNDGQITASPGPMPLASRTRNRASVPLAQESAWRAPQNAASSASSRTTSGPMMNWQ